MNAIESGEGSLKRLSQATRPAVDQLAVAEVILSFVIGTERFLTETVRIYDGLAELKDGAYQDSRVRPQRLR